MGYIRELQRSFDYGKIPYKKGCRAYMSEAPKTPECFEESGYFDSGFSSSRRGHDRPGKKISVNKALPGAERRVGSWRCTRMIRMCEQGTNVNHCRVGCLLLTFFLLWALPGCGSNAHAPEFPPAVETVQTVVEELGWTLDPEGTQSWTEDQILYTLGTEDRTRASVSCALVEGSRFLTENCVVTLLPNKPEFAWEDWKGAVALAETLYGGFSEGEFDQTLSEQNIPEPEAPPAGLDTPTGQESLG